MSRWNGITKQLQARRDKGLFRNRRLLETAQDCQVKVDGRLFTNFSSNDYLGLANDPRVVEAAKVALDQHGLGAGASHLVTGHHQLHEQLEEELALFTGRERVLCFSTGYMANLGVVAALADRHCLVVEDKLNHASLLDAGKLSGAQVQRYRHVDMQSLKERLLAAGEKRVLVVTDGVFSMDGDLAPLDEIAELCRQHDAMLMIDDAHGFGVLGERGGGCSEVFGLTQKQLPVLVGTFGKAFGTIGAFVAGSSELIEMLTQYARTYIYTTALPPAMAAATLASLHILQNENERRVHLAGLIEQFRHQATQLGYKVMPSKTPIQPILMGDTAKAVRLSEKLNELGILIPAIRPPTVPEGTARLRVTFSAGHTQKDVDNLIHALEVSRH